MSRLSYIGAVAHEVMRLRPVGPVVGLETVRDVVAGDIALPAKTPFVCS